MTRVPDGYRFNQLIDLDYALRHRDQNDYKDTFISPLVPPQDEASRRARQRARPVLLDTLLQAYRNKLGVTLKVWDIEQQQHVLTDFKVGNTEIRSCYGAFAISAVDGDLSRQYYAVYQEFQHAHGAKEAWLVSFAGVNITEVQADEVLTTTEVAATIM